MNENKDFKINGKKYFISYLLQGTFIEKINIITDDSSTGQVSKMIYKADLELFGDEEKYKEILVKKFNKFANIVMTPKEEKLFLKRFNF